MPQSERTPKPPKTWPDVANTLVHYAFVVALLVIAVWVWG